MIIVVIIVLHFLRTVLVSILFPVDALSLTIEYHCFGFRFLFPEEYPKFGHI